MKEQLLLLLELSKIDSRIQEVRSVMKALPEKLVPLQNDLSKLEAMLEAEKARLTETEQWRKEQESMIQQDTEAVRKAKAKVQAARSPKDYSAATREVDNKRRSISEREDEVLKVIEAMEASRKDIEAHTADVEKLRSHLQGEQEAVAAKLTELEAEATQHASGRDSITAKIQPSILKRYEHVLKRRAYAVAPVDGGVCQGCHMSVPPQLNNILARAESIEVCPRCHRLLFRKDAMGMEDGDSTDD